MKQLLDLDVSGKKVFLRVDLDVPIESTNDKRLTTNVRLQNIRPTVDYLFDHGAQKVVIAGHIGRPFVASAPPLVLTRGKQGKPEGVDRKLSTQQLAPVLGEILGRSVIFSDKLDVSAIENLVLLENLRFWPGEEKNDPEFAKDLAALADIYVNDAFAVSHRAHASIVGVPELLPHAAGLHLQEEVEELSRLLASPEKPYVAIIGGAKLETKVPVLGNLSKVADNVLVGGEIALEIGGKSTVYSLQSTAVVGSQNAVDKIFVAAMTPDTKDIDQTSIDKFKEIIASSKTIIWNGPMGLFEEGHDAGTKAIAEAIIASGAYSVVGGGETTEFLGSHGFLDKFSFVSTGGGAMLEFLSGKELPGIAALE